MGSVDLVTETDQRCEDLIIRLIKDHFPTHAIIGEESSGQSKYTLTDEPTWTIDPIDGTTNFVHRLNLSCVIIAYLHGKEPRAAVVHDPMAQETFWATKGKGSFMQRGEGPVVPMHVSETQSISKAVIHMEP